MTMPLACLIFLRGAVSPADPEMGTELLFPLQGQHVHSSSIVECPDGSLLVVWFQGSGERTANDVEVRGARLRKGDEAWSRTFQAADTPGVPDCNPVLFIDRRQRLWLFWIVVHTNRWERSILKYRTSTDYLGDGLPKWDWQDIILLDPGEDFADRLKVGFEALEPGEEMWAEYALPYTRLLFEAAKDPVKRGAGWMTRTHPITLATGRILLPLYSDGFNLGLVAYSDDEGATWQPSGPIVGLGPIQPSIVCRGNGTLAAYLRDSGGPPNRVLMSSSSDDGETWTEARDTDIPNPGSSLEVIRLADGRWLMVFNDTETGRHQLAVALSKDEGVSWESKRYLDKAAPGQGSFAYPSVCQGRDGRIHITYSYHVADGKSIKHVAFDPTWLTK